MFTSIEYLAAGNDRQRECYRLLRKISIFDLLRPYRPLLVGTIPIGIDLPGSDLDIICEAYDFEELHTVVSLAYSDYKNFSDRSTAGRYVARFFAGDHEIEIFAEAKPACQQWGYRHMMIEYRILQLFGEPFREKVIQLKTEGIKTEPAFAKLLGLVGDPYQALLELEKYRDEELSRTYTVAGLIYTCESSFSFAEHVNPVRIL